MKTMTNAPVCVVGMGRSGLAAARALANRGWAVVLSDGRSRDQIGAVVDDLPDNVELVFGGEVILRDSIVVLSPGIHPQSPVYRKAERLAGELIGEVELFFRLFDGRIVAVTGTDGKSTVTTLTAHLLNVGGYSAMAAGNLGNALCEIVASPEKQPDVVVAEVSCFQLLTIKRFRPEVALVTNLAADHIDVHGSYDAYMRAKARVVLNQMAGDVFVRNLDSAELAGWITPESRLAPDNGQRVWDISQTRDVANGVMAVDGGIYRMREGRRESICARSDIALVGSHNTENILLSVAAAGGVGLDDPSKLAKGLASYRGLPHRIEFVRELSGVRYYNDSKATNSHAAATGILAFDKPVILIAGGYEKGLDLGQMSDAIGQNCKKVFLTGDSAERMAREFPADTQKTIVESLSDAVSAASHSADIGDIVLFSPGTSSFDRYRSFEHRGDVFKEIVSQL